MNTVATKADYQQGENSSHNKQLMYLLEIWDKPTRETYDGSDQNAQPKF